MRNKLLPLALLAAIQTAQAQQPPSAGTALQQIPAAPIPQKPAPEIRVDRPGTGPVAAAEETRITVKRLQITGAQSFPAEQLLAVSGFEPGSELSLSELRGLAGRITQFYNQRGYFVAQAYLPAQDIQDGSVTLDVVEGRYGQITVNNTAPVAGHITGAALGGLESGAPVTVATLELGLLLLSDLPGVAVKSTLVPGASVGTSDLIIDVAPGQRITGSLDADNAGGRYTGGERLGATVNVNNPTGNGDVASLRVLTSGPGLNYGRLAYQIQAGKARIGAAYASLHYDLGREFTSLAAEGNARIASLYGSYPLLRSRATNLNVQLAYDDKAFSDKQNATATVVGKTAQVWMASLTGDHRDGLGGGGQSSGALTVTAGHIDTQPTPANSQGHYRKLGVSLSRLQGITDSTALYAALTGQTASKNLDNSEKLGLGGLNGVRAYPEGEAYGDKGHLLTLESRTLLPKFIDSLPGQLQFVAFADTGSVTLNKTPWVVGTNRRTLTGAGLGLTWAESNNFVVKAYLARKVGSSVATSAPDATNRFWLQAVKYF